MEHNITLCQELKQNSISDYEDFSDQPRLKPFRVKKILDLRLNILHFQRITQKVGAQEAPFMSCKHPILYIGIGIGRHSGAFIF